MTVYLDVTRLITWQGNYTGMERFAYEITKALKARTDVRLCAFSPAVGFVEIDVVDAKGRLSHGSFYDGPGLRQLLRTNKVEFARRYVARKRQQNVQRHLTPISLSPENTLVVYDGLWDRQDYIDAVCKASESGVKLAHVVHDMVPLVMPHVCFEYVTEAFGRYFDQIAPKIDILFPISKNTEKDFKDWYKSTLKPSLESVVIRHGDDFSHAKAVRPNLDIIPENFVLCVGTLEMRKNHYLLYQAYRLAAAKGLSLPKLVIVGREGWLAEMTMHAFKNDPLVRDNVILAGPLSDENLSWLYANCAFTAFPAVYEGWGLPAAESLSYGKVCASSDAGPLREVGGELNVYYSPYDAPRCLRALESLQNPSIRSEAEERIRRLYQPVTWESTATTIYNSTSEKYIHEAT